MNIHRRIIDAVGNQRAVHEIPVDEERTLQRIDAATLDAKMRISPWLLSRSLHISLGNVHAPDESHLAVNHAQLAVVAIVHLAGKSREAHGHEGVHVNARISHPFEEGVLHLPAAHVVINHSYFHSLLRLVYQRISHQIAQCIVLKDVSIQVDVMLGLTYII